MKHIPNILTMMRMLVIPFIPYTYIIQDNRVACILIIAFAGVSDFLDGYLARKFHLITDLGKVLDPLADKLLLIAIVLSLFYTKNFPTSLLIGFLLLEVGMILLGSLLFTRKDRVVIPSNIFGKVATGLFFLTAILSIWYGYTNLIAILFYLTLIIKLIAFSQYILHYFKRVKN